LPGQLVQQEYISTFKMRPMPSEPHGTGISGVFHNQAFFCAFMAFLVAQVAKVFTYWYTDGILDYSRLAGSGGMPSSHTAFVIGLTTSVGLTEGTSSHLFAACLVFSLVVMYDASGVRLHAGKHASVLNLIMSELPPDHPVQETGRLRDTLGHTPLQVFVGAGVGLVVGYLTQVSMH
jgi:acid phosphatase family membrane protein YuiD